MSEEKIEGLLPSVLEQIENSKNQSVLTGFEDLDEMFCFPKGGVITIAGRPAMGKTSFMFSIINNLIPRQNKKVLLFDMLQSKNQVVSRLLCINSETDSRRIRTGELGKSDWDKLSVSMSEMAEWNLYIDDDSAKTVEEIEEAVIRLKPEIVVIDYLQLIYEKSKKDRNFQLEDIMKSLNRIAKDNGVIIFLLSQLTRAPEERSDKRPQLSDLRGSSAIEVLSDVVMFIYRQAYYGVDIEEDYVDKNEAEIIVAKNKYGPTGVVRMLYKPFCSKFVSKLRSTYEF